MSRAPWVVLKPDKPFPRTSETMYSTTLGWRMVNPEMPDEWTVSLGEGAEILADRYGITREQQDEFALNSHRKAAAAWDRGAFADEVVAMEELERDENIRADTHAREARPAQAGVPQGRHGDGGQLVADERRRLGAAAVRRRGRRAGADRSAAPRAPSSRSSTASARSRPRTRRSSAPASAGAT